MVIGAVDHDHWKNAISVEASDNGRVNVLKVYSGASTSETRDVLPHGKLKGPKISSARMFVEFADDWRTGMETFARANTMVQPMRGNGIRERLSAGKVGAYWKKEFFRRGCGNSGLLS